jgi:hypothetical protein
MERSEGDIALKNPVTPPGIDPGTVRLVAQRLNHYATPGPYYVQYYQVGFMLLTYILVLTVKVEFTLEQTTKTQRGSRGIALLFL